MFSLGQKEKMFPVHRHKDMKPIWLIQVNQNENCTPEKVKIKENSSLNLSLEKTKKSIQLKEERNLIWKVN